MRSLIVIASAAVALFLSANTALAQLPLNQPVEITFTPKKSGQIRYAYAADMVAGVIIVD